VPAETPADRRERAGWYACDFGNSAFSTTVVTVFFGPYLTTITAAAADAGGFVHPLGVPVRAGALFPYVVSLAVLLQMVLLPMLGAIADYTRRKKAMLIGFAYLGAASTVALGLVAPRGWLLAAGCFLVASVSFGASFLCYNAYLIDIAAPDERDAVSSRGWAVGYLGGGLLLALNLALVASAPRLGLDGATAVRMSLASAGLWWGAAMLLPLAWLRVRVPARALPPGTRLATLGFTRTLATLGAIVRRPQTRRFLAAYLLYNDGVQTVIVLAAQFGHEELGLPMATLATVILAVQLVAAAGALLGARVARMLGARVTILLSLAVWSAALVGAWGGLRGVGGFWTLAVVIAVVLGGTQALSRSLFSLMVPRGEEAEYFAFYEVSDRGTGWLGPLLFGVVLQLAGSYRLAMLALVGFFAAGALLLARLDVTRAVAEAGRTPA
jgi:UMF1 family MFS transporter